VKVHRIDKVNHNASWLTSTAEKQVTLCVAVLKIGVNFTFDPVNADKNKTLITPPFNDVLFDAASFRGLGGEVLDTTRLCASSMASSPQRSNGIERRPQV
jgi:hypothetical protein